MTREKLFQTSKERGVFLAFITIVFTLSFLIIVWQYHTLTSHSFYEGKGIVDRLTPYSSTKTGTTYNIATFKTDSGLLVKSIISTPLHLGDTVSLRFSTDLLHFRDFFSSYFVPQLTVQAVQPAHDFRAWLINAIAKQHDSPLLRELYLALYLDEPLSHSTQTVVSLWGLAALLSLSGLNVAILWGILFFIFSALYRPFQDRFFPYRNRNVDVGILTLIVLGAYVVLSDFNPSFVRAYCMALCTFFLYIRGVRLDSGENLLAITLLSLALFPTFIFSIGFWFSVAGVAMIFSTLHYVKAQSKIIIALVINLSVFIGMLPFVHSFFPLFSPLQLTSLLANIAFDLFYPVSLLLHTIGLGGILDGIMEHFFLTIKAPVWSIQTPFWFLILHSGSIIISFWKKEAFFLWQLNGLLFFVVSWGIFGS